MYPQSVSDENVLRVLLLNQSGQAIRAFYVREFELKKSYLIVDLFKRRVFLTQEIKDPIPHSWHVIQPQSILQGQTVQVGPWWIRCDKLTLDPLVTLPNSQDDQIWAHPWTQRNVGVHLGLALLILFLSWLAKPLKEVEPEKIKVVIRPKSPTPVVNSSTSHVLKKVTLTEKNQILKESKWVDKNLKSPKSVARQMQEPKALISSKPKALPTKNLKAQNSLKTIKTESISSKSHTQTATDQASSRRMVKVANRPKVNPSDLKVEQMNQILKDELAKQKRLSSNPMKAAFLKSSSLDVNQKGPELSWVQSVDSKSLSYQVYSVGRDIQIRSKESSGVSLPDVESSSGLYGLDRDQVAAAIAQNRHKFSWCYEKALRQDPTLQGFINLKFRIHPLGHVSQVQVVNSNITDKFLQNCVVRALGQIKFPKPLGNVFVEVVYPLHMRKISQN